MLFQQSYEQIKKMFDDGMPKITPKTITDVAVLYKQLQEMKVDDISHENEESSPGIQCYGTPVRYNERIIAAVSISFPAWISDTEQLQKIKNSLLQEKKQIERIISNNPSRWIYSNLK
jgi:DNA-binding IclR family transcriptional regulator